MAVTLAPVEERDLDAFFAMLRDYHDEMDTFDPRTGEDAWDASQYEEAIRADLDGQELLWILDDGEHAGLLIILTLPDWPDDRRSVATISECYVTPQHRRRGVGSAAVDALLAEHRERGTYEVEAGILVRNGPARAFWERLGFETRSLQTARRP